MELHDVRYALRLMRRSPGFTAVAVLSLALGIGANTAIYSLFYTIVERPLPVDHPEQLVQFVQDTPTEYHWMGYWGWAWIEAFRNNHVFTDITGMAFDNLAQIRPEGGEPETLVEEVVLGNYFRVLGLKPAMGRFFTPEDVPAKGAGNVVVVSWSYWKTRLHGDPAVIGRRLFDGNDPKTIVGVAPRSYVGPRVGMGTDVWIPREHGDQCIVARLKPGMSVAQAQAEMEVLFGGARMRIYPGQRAAGRRIEILPLGSGLVRIRDQFGKPLLLLLGVVGALLLLACINMAGMLLARSAGRQRELAVRVSLGASRIRLVRQMLTESVLLSCAGTAVGILAAYSVTGALVGIIASGRVFDRYKVEVHPDLHLVLFTAGIAIVTGMVFGLAPSWYAFHTAPAAGLRSSRLWGFFGKGLVAAQVALSLLLVTAAALFLGHLSRLRHFDLGFRSDHVLTITADLSHSGYRREQLPTLYRDLLARFESIPGVRSASVSGCFPMEGCGIPGVHLTAEGHVERPEERWIGPFGFVGPRYFETLGVPIIAGRDFSFQDAGKPRVVILNQALARRLFPGENPIGKHIAVEGEPQPYEVIGVAGDVKGEIRDAPYPAPYFNHFQVPRLLDRFVLRTSGDPMASAANARRLILDVLKTPVSRMITLEAQIDADLVPERLTATLSEVFGALAAVLAGIGLYGLLAFTVARRTNEIGIRMALGATTGRVSALVLRDALVTVAIGVAVGAMLVWRGKPLAQSLLADLKWEPAAPLIAGGISVLLVAILAAYVPARRAATVDPMAALREP